MTEERKEEILSTPVKELDEKELERGIDIVAEQIEEAGEA